MPKRGLTYVLLFFQILQQHQTKKVNCRNGMPFELIAAKQLDKRSKTYPIDQNMPRLLWIQCLLDYQITLHTEGNVSEAGRESVTYSDASHLKIFSCLAPPYCGDHTVTGQGWNYPTGGEGRDGGPLEHTVDLGAHPPYHPPPPGFKVNHHEKFTPLHSLSLFVGSCIHYLHSLFMILT